MDVSPFAVVPFASLLLAIAILPLIAPRFWHRNRNRALVALGLSVPIVAYLGMHGASGMLALVHACGEYSEFVLLLGALYTVAGGILVEGRFRPTPMTNVLFLATGAVLANVIGTTGASMVLARPLLRLNRARTRRSHVPVFFVFVVANVGGLLTPLGDPPLFLGYLRGIAFTFPLSLWPHWLMVNATVIAVFYAWDQACAWRELPRSATPACEPLLAVHGRVNVFLLAGVVGCVLLRSPDFGGFLHALARPWPAVVPSFVLLAISAASLTLTPAGLRAANGFTWSPLVEVAVLFLGLFITMVPALALLERHGADLGLTEAWQFFWATGTLSACLDNAPTYLAFATIAGHGQPLAALVANDPCLLQAISAGAVFFGAMTYIGNGPNLMVKALAEDLGYTMPSFGAYFAAAAVVLLPIFAIVSIVFFS